MARLKFNLHFRDATLPSANAWKTMCSIKAPSNQMVAILGCKFGVSGISGSDEPFRFRLNRVTAGTGTATTITPQKLCGAFTATVQSTCKNVFTAEPSDLGSPEYLFDDMFHPQGGLLDVLSAAELDLILKEGTELALQIFVPSGGPTTYKVSGWLSCEE